MNVWICNYTTANSALFDFDSDMFVPADQVCEWRSPEQLKELLDLELRDGGESESEILQRFKDAIRYSVKTSECLKFNELRSEHRDTTLGKWLPECFCSSDVEGHLMNPGYQMPNTLQTIIRTMGRSGDNRPWA